ncbi:hypothetical protein B0H12DRAFT_1114260 [Mycena haematopus]|nr:hypothetical protein B0H12DRAFT_1114260 [Mycena haematopus]
MVKKEKTQKQHAQFASRAFGSEPTCNPFLTAGPVGPAQGWEPPSRYGRRGRGEGSANL